MTGFAHKGTGDHTANPQFALKHGTRCFAEFIKLFTRIQALVASDLKHAVCGGVNDGFAGGKMLCTQFIQDGCAGGGLVTKCAMADSGFIFGHELCRKTVRECRERFIKPQTTDFPVAGGCILAGTFFHCTAISANSIRVGGITGSWNLTKAKFGHVGKAWMALCYHMGDGGCACIAVLVRIGKIANANTVQNR